MPRPAVIPFLFFLLLPGIAAATDATAPPLIAERLSLMKDVAIYKAERDIPVEDLAREAVVLDAVVKAAAEHGLVPETTRAFFQAQIDAAKHIQACWIGRWSSGEARPAQGADLVEVIRPELLRLGNAIVAAIAVDIRDGHSADSKAFHEVVVAECLSGDASAAMARALGEIALQ